MTLCVASLLLRNPYLALVLDHTIALLQTLKCSYLFQSSCFRSTCHEPTPPGPRWKYSHVTEENSSASGKCGRPRMGSSSFQPDSVQSCENPAKVPLKSSPNPQNHMFFSEVQVIPWQGWRGKIRLRPVKSIRPHLRSTPFARRLHKLSNFNAMMLT